MARVLFTKKSELLRFLEPFTDDIRVVIVGHDNIPQSCMFEAAEAEYRVATDEDVQCASSTLGLTRGDGFIVLWQEVK